MLWCYQDKVVKVPLNTLRKRKKNIMQISTSSRRRTQLLLSWDKRLKASSKHHNFSNNSKFIDSNLKVINNHFNDFKQLILNSLKLLNWQKDFQLKCLFKLILSLRWTSTTLLIQASNHIKTKDLYKDLSLDRFDRLNDILRKKTSLMSLSLMMTTLQL